MFVLVGLPGAGKTTTARTLAARHGALRLTPDEWMAPLFGEPEAGGKRDVLEGRLISVSVQLLRLGTSVVLDFGCWSRDERSALRWLAEQEGAAFHLVYLAVDRATQLARIAQRWQDEPADTFAMTESDVDRWQAAFEAPDATELAGAGDPAPPAPWSSWLQWAAERWPSLSTG